MRKITLFVCLFVCLFVECECPRMWVWTTRKLWNLWKCISVIWSVADRPSQLNAGCSLVKLLILKSSQESTFPPSVTDRRTKWIKGSFSSKNTIFINRDFVFSRYLSRFLLDGLKIGRYLCNTLNFALDRFI